MAAYKREFYPTWESVRTHSLPAWYHEAKLGIFIHWGLYSIPAFAPPTCELGVVTGYEWYSNNPYAEWYWNSLRIEESSTRKYHNEKYGADFSYNDFEKMFTAEKFNAANWAELFKKSGARYIVPVTKHHDGYCLWDTKYTDFNSVAGTPKKDFMQELATAVRAEDMRFCTYYSGIIDWQYANAPIYDDDDLYSPPNVTSAYSDFAFNQVMELIDTFKPDLIWNDIAWPKKGLEDLPTLLSYYYNTNPDAVVNDRWSGLWNDFTTKEYQSGKMDLTHKWEMCRGLGLSFGYNAEEGEEHIISEHDLIALLVKTVSHNGNLLINVGPHADGSIPAIQAQRLMELGAWMEQNGDAIYGTDIWTEQVQELADGSCVYFTQKDGNLYLFVDPVDAEAKSFLIAGLGKYAAGLSAMGSFEFSAVDKDGDLQLDLAAPAAAEVIAVLKTKLN